MEGDAKAVWEEKVKGLSLFSGIGGLDLAAEWAGIEPVVFCEIEPYAQKVLKKRWPDVPIIEDVRTIRGEDFGAIDIIYGGFPCQDLSVAGKGAGLTGERSGLWFEMLRVIHGIRPTWVLAENVRGAVNKALDTVREGLEGEGYEVRALVIPASAVGAPHQRERLFVVAHSGCELLPRPKLCGEDGSQNTRGAADIAERSGTALWPTPSVCGNDNRKGLSPKSGDGLSTSVKTWLTPKTPTGGGLRKIEDQIAQVLSGQLNPDWVECLMGFPLSWTDVDCTEPEPWPGFPALMGERLWMTPKAGVCGMTAKTKGRPLEKSTHLSSQTFVAERDCADQFPYEPPRTGRNIPNRAKRLKALGNAVVPQQAYPLFRAIVDMDEAVKEPTA